MTNGIRRFIEVETRAKRSVFRYSCVSGFVVAMAIVGSGFAQTESGSKPAPNPIDLELFPNALGPMQPVVQWDFPVYPAWLTRILVGLNDPGARARMGFAQLLGIYGFEEDPCAGRRNLQIAATQGNLTALYWLLSDGLIRAVDEGATDGPVFMWLFHWAKATDFKEAYVNRHLELLKVSPASAVQLRTRFETWSPAMEPLPEPSSCQVTRRE